MESNWTGQGQHSITYTKAAFIIGAQTVQVAQPIWIAMARQPGQQRKKEESGKQSIFTTLTFMHDLGERL